MSSANTGPHGPPRWRAYAARALVVVSAVTLTIALAVGWAQRTLFDGDEFADRAVTLLDSSVVRHALAEQITDQLVENGSSSLGSFRSDLVGVVSDVIDTSGFRSIFHDAVQTAHDTVFRRHGDAALLELGETLKLLSENARRRNESLGDSLPAATGSLLIDFTPTLRRLDLWRFTQEAGWLDEIALVATVVALTGALILDRRRYVFVMAGVGIVAAGVAIVVVAELLPGAVTNAIDDPSLAGAIRTGVTTFVADLKALGLWTIPFGIILAAAAEATRPSHTPADPRALVVRARQWWAGDLGRPTRFGIGAATVATGIVMLLARHALVDLAVLLIGAFVVYRGMVVVVRSVLGAAVDEERAPHGTSRRVLGRWSMPHPRRFVVALSGAVVVVLLASAVVIDVADAGAEARERSVLRCNGSADLCDRPLDQVAFAGSHNSMSAASDPGWLYAENLHGIPAQLQYGIRAFLVKTHYGIPTGITLGGAPLVVTDKAAEVAYDPKAEAAELGDEAVTTVERIDAAAPKVSAQHEIYLCHGYCELGATKFSSTLADLRDFMDRNPDDVLFLIIGDYVTPADTEKAFEQAGLIDRLWRYRADQALPTLRQMITAKRTLFVLAERDAGKPDWYNPAYQRPTGIFQDTPFTFATERQFSCAENRGPRDAPLFQINHWITNRSAPSAGQARTINSYDVLMGRVRKCEDQRGRFPTVIAVNFYDQGDLLRVVHDLNDDDSPTPTGS